MRRLLLPLAIVGGVAMLAAFAVSCGDDDDDDGAPQEVQVDDSRDGDTVEVAEGGTLIVALPSNASTGFSWSIVPPEPQGLELDGEPVYVPAGSTTQVVGAGGTQVFTFDATAKGETTLNMAYARSDGVPDKTYTLTVQIR